MKKAGIREVSCPKCGSNERQIKKGFTKAGSQQWHCYACKIKYTPNPKKWQYSEEEKENAKRLYYLGLTGRGVGKYFKMNKSNIYRWIAEAGKKDNESMAK